MIPRQRIVKDVYRVLVEQLGYNTDVVLAFKLDGWAAYRCPAANCDLEEVYHPIIRCGRLHPYVSYKHSSRAAANVLDRVIALGCDYVLCLDLTIDADRSDRVGPADVREMYKAAGEFLKELYRLLYPRKKGSFGGWAAVHIWKTQTPVQPKLHLHLVIPNVVRDGDRLVRFHPYLNPRVIRLAWHIVSKKHGWIDPDQVPNVRVRYIKVADRSKLIARLTYMFRRPIEDLNVFLNEDMLNDHPDWDFIQRVIEYSPRLRAVGFCVRLKSLGIIVPKSKTPICPICGSSLIKVGQLRKLPPGIGYYTFNVQGKLEKIDGWGS